MQVTGRFSPHPRGFGFVDPPEPVAGPSPEPAGEADGAPEIASVFVPPPLTAGWLADDVVTAEVEVDEQGRATATALGLVQRPRRFVVGTLRSFAGRLVLRPDPRLGAGQLELAGALAERLPPLSEGRQIVTTVTQAEDGAVVCGSLVTGPDPAASPSAIRARAVVIAHGAAVPDAIPGGPAAVGLPVAETLGTALRLTGHLAAGNPGLAAGLDTTTGPVPGVELPLEDRRDELCVTIDADETRDLDDALAASWSGAADAPVQLAVHIADASGTVGIGSPADRYAATVATSAYLIAGPRAPMLDPALSEGELSLLPEQPRRVVTVRLAVAPDGSTSEPTVETAWIEPTARLSYAAVDAYLDDGDPLHLSAGTHGSHGAPMAVVGAVSDTVDALAEASRRLGVERDARDTLEWLFESATLEPATIDGRIRAVPADPHPRAQRLVERAMVAANEAVAGWAAAAGVPLLYRSHVGFDPERLPALRAAAASVGVELPDPVVPADVLAAVDELRAAERQDAAAVIATAATGVVARAGYSAEPAGHGGLASGYYTHFTSPIRRYADLVVHRQVRAALAGEPPPYDAEQLERLARWLDVRAGAADHAQALERNGLWAILLERGALPWPTEAVVVGLSPAGLRVRLLAPGLGGFITAERAVGASGRQRVTLELDESGLATADGRYRLGTRLPVRLDRIDDLGRPELTPAR